MSSKGNQVIVDARAAAAARAKAAAAERVEELGGLGASVAVVNGRLSLGASPKTQPPATKLGVQGTPVSKDAKVAAASTPLGVRGRSASIGSATAPTRAATPKPANSKQSSVSSSIKTAASSVSTSTSGVKRGRSAVLDTRTAKHFKVSEPDPEPEPEPESDYSYEHESEGEAVEGEYEASVDDNASDIGHADGGGMQWDNDADSSSDGGEVEGVESGDESDVTAVMSDSEYSALVGSAPTRSSTAHAGSGSISTKSSRSGGGKRRSAPPAPAPSTTTHTPTPAARSSSKSHQQRHVQGDSGVETHTAGRRGGRSHDHWDDGVVSFTSSARKPQRERESGGLGVRSAAARSQPLVQSQPEPEPVYFIPHAAAHKPSRVSGGHSARTPTPQLGVRPSSVSRSQTRDSSDNAFTSPSRRGRHASASSAQSETVSEATPARLSVPDKLHRGIRLGLAILFALYSVLLLLERVSGNSSAALTHSTAHQGHSFTDAMTHTAGQNTLALLSAFMVGMFTSLLMD